MPSKQPRAQIFAPFDALKGLQELLREKERIIVSKKELSEDDCALLDYKIRQIKKGMMIKIVYYDKKEYVELEGIVSKIDLEYQKMIQIVQQVILIDNIVSISGDEITDE